MPGEALRPVQPRCARPVLGGFEWNDASRTLTIGARKGKFKGMLKARRFNVVVVDGHTPAGDKPARGRRVGYNGSRLEVKL